MVPGVGAGPEPTLMCNAVNVGVVVDDVLVDGEPVVLELDAEG